MPTLQRDYGDIVTMRYYSFRVYFISHPDYIEQVLVTDNRKFIKGRILRKNKQLFGNGLLTSEGDFWLRQRRLAQPAFHRGRVASYADTMVRYASRIAKEWRSGEECDIHAEMMRLTLSIVAKTLFDADVDREAKRVGHALEAIMHLNSDFRKLILTPTWLPTPRKVRATIATAKLNRIIYRFVEERRASGVDNGDLLSMLLAARDDDGSRMTDRQLRDEAITIFLAGHETTANALAWTWMLLAQNPQVESKLHEELGRVLGGRVPTVDDLPSLRYTNNVITESLRLYPPAWGMAHGDRRIPNPERMRRVSRAMGGSSRSAMVRGAARVSTRALGRRLAEAIAAFRVLSLWRRPETMHRQQFCRDGGESLAGDAGSTISNISGAGTGNHSGGVDHAPSEDWDLGKDRKAQFSSDCIGDTANPRC
jgi:cytochrome P450